jgi:23S rRNA (cytidine1920-2'-O)/16S rRNA (cytidine1409-2'-O)-methyltransferase
VDDRLKQHKGLTLIKANARNAAALTPEQIGFAPDIITIDVSFISVTKILPVLAQFKRAKIIVLVKPQFEADRKTVGKGGVIRQKEKRLKVILELKKRITELNYCVANFTSAGIKGRKGNQEYFFLLQYGNNPSINDKIITNGIDIEL